MAAHASGESEICAAVVAIDVDAVLASTLKKVRAIIRLLRIA
jgi:hypothetical protein